ncbi:MAG: hypothetical protein JO278_13050 [Dyella sp.]|nr:hypothetical protein [Dyella sp.]MBV8272528.1 hypothetical protein [Cupriavidus sp.]
MSQSTLFLAARAKICRASYRLAGASWQGASFLSDVALQTMTASLTGGMLLMAAACSMYAISMVLLHLDSIPR